MSQTHPWPPLEVVRRGLDSGDAQAPGPAEDCGTHTPTGSTGADAPSSHADYLLLDEAFDGLDPQGVTIWWGAYLGMPEQILMHGPLASSGPEIIAARTDARARHGWIMDIYLLERG